MELSTIGTTISKQSSATTDFLKDKFYQHCYEFRAQTKTPGEEEFGTGFRVGNFFLTNAHVIQYMFEEGIALDPEDNKIYVINLETGEEMTVRLKLVSRLLDAAAAVYPGKNYSSGSGLKLATPSRGQKIFLLTQSDLMGKAIVGGSVESTDLELEGNRAKYSFTYRIDTTAGTSGSPLLNKDGEVVGMHWGTEADSDMSYGVPGGHLKDWLADSPSGSVDEEADESNLLENMTGGDKGATVALVVGGSLVLTSLAN